MANVQKYSIGACGRMTQHYRRTKDTNGEYVKIGKQKIDPARTHLNYNLAPERAQGEVAFIRQRVAEVHHMNRADVVTMADWVVTLPKTPPEHLIDRTPPFTPEKEEEIFFERCYKFLSARYGEQNVITAPVHKDEHQPHIHFAFVPVVPDKKHGGEKLSAKERLDRRELEQLHTDLQQYLDSFGDLHWEMQNEATKDGNLTVQQLKYRTAKEDALKATQEAAAARAEAQKAAYDLLAIKSSVTTLEGRRRALEGQIAALNDKLTTAEQNEFKGRYNARIDHENRAMRLLSAPALEEFKAAWARAGIQIKQERAAKAAENELPKGWER